MRPFPIASIAFVALVAFVADAGRAGRVAHADSAEDLDRLQRTLAIVHDLAYSASAPATSRDVWLASDSAYYEPTVAEILEGSAREYRGGFLQLALAAGASSDLSTPGALNGAIDTAWEIPLCRVLGAHARGLQTTESVGAWALGGTACLPLPVNTLQVSYTRRENVRGSLLQRAIVLDDRRAEHEIGMMVRAYRWMNHEHSFALAPTTIDLMFSASAEGEKWGNETMDMHVTTFEWRRRGRGFAGNDAVMRLFAIRHVEQADAGSLGAVRTSVATFTPLALDGFHVTDSVAFGADAGFAMGWVQERREYRPNDPTMPPPAAPPPLYGRTLGHFDLWLGLEIDDLAGGLVDDARYPARARLGYTRTLAPTFDGQFVLENRATAHLEVARETFVARGEAFAGHALLDRPGTNEGKAIYGAGGDVAYALLRHVHAVGRIEGARTLAPGLAMDPVVARWDLRATVGVTAHVDKRW